MRAIVAVKSLAWISAFLLAAGLAASQILLGGWWYPALAAPGYLLAGAAAVAAGLAFRGARDAPGAICSGVTLLFAGYLLWRQSEAPDAYVAREDTLLLLGALCVYFTAAWQLRDNGPRWLLLSALFLLATVQTVTAVAQFAAQTPFHPLGDLALHMGLSSGGERMVRHGGVFGTLESRGTLSSILQVTSFLALGMLVWGKAKTWGKILLFWVAATGFAALILCTSRAAYVGISSGMVMFALISFFIVRRGALAHKGLLSAGILVFLTLPLTLGIMIGAESTTIQLRLLDLGADSYREKLWFVTVPPMLELDPWLGAGANMFDQLSLRYRATGFDGRAVHAHNDWLQLLIEYGRAGLVLGALFFVTHLAAGWRNALRLSRETTPDGWLPQSMELGLLSGSLAAATSQGMHALFDYRLHLPAVVLLLALCAGWLAGARVAPVRRDTCRMSPWLRFAAFLLPMFTGALLLMRTLHEAPAEYDALQAENAMMRKEPEVAWNLAEKGLNRRPENPRLLILAGEAALALGNTADNAIERKDWYRRAADFFDQAIRQRPYFGYAWRERALTLDGSEQFWDALSAHLRAIAREPDNARGYEYLALHYWWLGRPDEAERLFRLAKRLPGASLASGGLKMIEQSRPRNPGKK